MNASLSTPALVIRRSDWRDYDRMVTLFTPEYGRIDAVARGCRRPKSPLMNASEPFTAGEYQLLRVKDRYTITQVRITDSFFALRVDYEKLSHGAYWLKLLEEVVVLEEPNALLFETSLNALAYLANSDIPPALLTAMFEMQMWRILGFAPAMEACVKCGVTSDRAILRFDAQSGGCVCPFCSPSAHALTEGARRILLKAPKTPYRAVEKLINHPDWPEAAQRIREFTFARLGHSVKGAP